MMIKTCLVRFNPLSFSRISITQTLTEFSTRFSLILIIHLLKLIAGLTDSHIKVFRFQIRD
jgi:hypothetical protein